MDLPPPLLVSPLLFCVLALISKSHCTSIVGFLFFGLNKASNIVPSPAVTVSYHRLFTLLVKCTL